MNNKGLLFSIPASLLVGTTMVGASQMTTLLPMAVSPNSNQQVLVKMPIMGAFQPVAFWSGIAIAVGGTIVPILLSPKEEEPEYFYQGGYQPPTLVIEPPTLATIGQQQEEFQYDQQEQEYHQPVAVNEPASPIPVVFPQRAKQPEPVEFSQFAKQQEFEEFAPVGKFTPEDPELPIGLPEMPASVPHFEVLEQEPQYESTENLEDVWGDDDDDDQGDDESDIWNEFDEVGEESGYEPYEEDEDESEGESIASPTSPVSSHSKPTPIAYSHRTVQPSDSEVKLDKFEEPSICEAIAATNKPLIICSPPGTGKTSTIRAVITEIFRQDPSAELHIVDRKNGAGKESGRWMGLEKIPGVVVAPDKHLGLLLDKCDLVADIVEKRRQMHKSEVVKQHNVWLILDDYLAMYERSKTLLTILPKDSDIKMKLASYHADLCDIAYDGRELKVRVVILTHSPNCEDLGLSGGKKRSFAFFVLGFLDKTQGLRADGGFGAISAALAQPSIFPNKHDRDGLQKYFNEVSRVSTERGRPMFLTTMGTPRLGLMPDLSWTETYQLPLDMSALDSEPKQEDEKKTDALDYLARFWDTHRNKDNG